MEQRPKIAQITLIELLAFLQGVAVGLIPAFEKILTNPDMHALSNLELRILYLPFMVAAVLLASIGGWVSHYGHQKKVFYGGMGANLLAVLLLAVTAFTIGDRGLTIGFLWIALFFHGCGFGLLMTVLSKWTISQPFLWAAVSLGITFAPVLVEFSFLLHDWWLAPTIVFAAFVILLLGFDLFSSYPVWEEEPVKVFHWKIPLFFCAALLYGYIIGTFELMKNLEGLLWFWAIATLTRLITAFLPYERFWFLVLPLPLLVGLFYGWWLIPIGVGALFPLNLALMEKTLARRRSLLIGLGIAFYIFGIGLGGVVEWGAWIAAILVIVLHILTFIRDPQGEKQTA